MLFFNSPKLKGALCSSSIFLFSFMLSDFVFTLLLLPSSDKLFELCRPTLTKVLISLSQLFLHWSLLFSSKLHSLLSRHLFSIIPPTSPTGVVCPTWVTKLSSVCPFCTVLLTTAQNLFVLYYTAELWCANFSMAGNSHTPNSLVAKYLITYYYT